jgi:hypothetical protein
VRWSAPRPPATARCSSPRDARGPRGRPRRGDCVVSRAPATSRSTRSRRRSSSAPPSSPAPTPTASCTTPPGSTWSCSSRSRRSSAARSTDYANGATAPARADGNDLGDPVRRRLPCATQNELTGRDAKALVATGASPSPRARTCPAPRGRCGRFLDAGVAFGPGQGRQRRRGRHLGAGDAAERQPRPWTFEHTEAGSRDHDRHPRTVPRDRRGVRRAGQLRVGANISRTTSSRRGISATCRWNGCARSSTWPTDTSSRFPCATWPDAPTAASNGHPAHAVALCIHLLHCPDRWRS